MTLAHDPSDLRTPSRASLRAQPGQQLDTLAFLLGALGITLVVHLWLWRQHRARVPPFTWFAIVVVLCSAAYIAQLARERAQVHMASMVAGYAPTYAAEPKLLGHAEVGTNTLSTSPRYLDLVAAEKRWLAENRSVNDIYTRRRAADGSVYFVVDSETDYERNGRFDGDREGRTAIGETFANRSRALAQAFAGERGFDGEPYHDRWGSWVSACWPILDSSGSVEAVVGVDYAARDWISASSTARVSVFGVAAVLLVLLLAAAAVIALQSAQLRLREENARCCSLRRRLPRRRAV